MDLSKLETIDRRIKYYELILERELNGMPCYELPEGYHFEFYQDGDKNAWLEIELSAKEFLCHEKGVAAWNKYYGGRESELYNRMIFLVTDNGEKIGTATAFYDVLGERKPGEGWLHWVAIKKEYQGIGLSKPLISFALQQLKGLGYKKAKIPTQTTTWVAVKVYLDFGFLPTNENVTESEGGWRIIKMLTHHPSIVWCDAAQDSEVFRTLN